MSVRVPVMSVSLADGFSVPLMQEGVAILTWQDHHIFSQTLCNRHLPQHSKCRLHSTLQVPMTQIYFVPQMLASTSLHNFSPFGASSLPSPVISDFGPLSSSAPSPSTSDSSSQPHKRPRLSLHCSGLSWQ